MSEERNKSQPEQFSIISKSQNEFSLRQTDRSRSPSDPQGPSQIISKKQFKKKPKEENEGLLTIHENAINNNFSAEKTEEEKQKNQKQYNPGFEETKNQILECLKNWFNNSKRLMDEDEIEYIARTLETEPHFLAKIQLAYFEQLKSKNGKKYGNIENEKNNFEETGNQSKKEMNGVVPVETSKNSGPKEEVHDKSGSQAYLSKFDKMLHIRKLAQAMKTNKYNQKIDMELDAKEELKIGSNEIQKAVESQENGIVGNMMHEKAENQENFFDIQINELLDKMLIGRELKQQSEGQEFLSQKIPEQINLEATLIELTKNPNKFKREQHFLLSEVLSPNEIIQRNTPKENQINPGNDTFSYKTAQFDKKQVSVLKPLKKLNNPFRSTSVFKNDKGKSIMVQKIKPVLFRNEYFFQTIVDTVDEKSNRSIKVITRRENGELVEEQMVDLNLAGSFYENYVVENLDGKETYLLLRNESKVTALKTVIHQNFELVNLRLVKVFEKNGYCLDAVSSQPLPDNETRKLHKLRPILIGGEYYRQIVEDIIEKNNKKKLTVFTYNEKNVEISAIKANANLIENSNYMEVISDQIDFEGTIQVVLATKNELGQLICKQTFVSNLDSQMVDNGCNQMLEEIEYEEGEKQLTIGFKNSRGILQIARKLIGQTLEDEYYVELKNDFEEEGERYVVFVGKSFGEELLVEKLYKPELRMDITLAFYQDMIKELKEEVGQKYLKPTSKFRFDEFFTCSYIRFEIKNNQAEGKILMRGVDQRDVVIMESSFEGGQGTEIEGKFLDELVTKMEEALNRINEGGIRKRRFKADFAKNHTVLSRSPNDVAANIGSDRNLNFSYYKNKTVSEENASESQLLVKNQLPRFAKIPRSYFRNLQKELSLFDQKIGDYVAQSKSIKEVIKTQAISEKVSIPIRGPKQFKTNKPIVLSNKQQTSQKVAQSGQQIESIKGTKLGSTKEKKVDQGINGTAVKNTPRKFEKIKVSLNKLPNKNKIKDSGEKIGKDKILKNLKSNETKFEEKMLDKRKIEMREENEVFQGKLPETWEESNNFEEEKIVEKSENYSNEDLNRDQLQSEIYEEEEGNLNHK